MSLSNVGPVVLVGAGKMGLALARGWVAGGLPPAQLVLVDPKPGDETMRFAREHDIRLLESPIGILTHVMVLAVKPQVIRQVMEEIAPAAGPHTLALSIAAGISIATIAQYLPTDRIVRAMPNTPSQIRRGIAVWTASPACTARQRDLARSVLKAIGQEKEVGDETFVAMATALSGTGPTYLFAVMEALIDAGVHMGFPRELAHDLVVETLIGSAEYASQSELHPAQLRNLVTSPGGTSAAAIYELEKGRIRTVLSDAVWAAYRRTLELGERREQETGG